MAFDLYHLQRTLLTHRRMARRAAVADSCITGTIAFFIAAGVLIAVQRPIGFAIFLAAASAWLAWRRPLPLDCIAVELDDRHGLSDLLSSAWAVRRVNEPWAAALRSTADARAASLPPSPWPGRWTVRRSACGLAMAMAALLLTQLIPAKNAQADTHSDASAAPASSATPDPQFIADARPRPADTAGSQTRLPSENESAANGQSNSDPAQGATKDAAGTGQADSRDRSSMTVASSAAEFGEPIHAAGGHRASQSHVGGPSPGGTLQTEPGQQSDQTIEPTKTPPRAAANERPVAPSPAAYRDLVSDFFAR